MRTIEDRVNFVKVFPNQMWNTCSNKKFSCKKIKSCPLRRDKIFQPLKIPVATGFKEVFYGIAQKLKNSSNRKVLCGGGIVFHTSDFTLQKYILVIHIVKSGFA